MKTIASCSFEQYVLFYVAEVNFENIFYVIKFLTRFDSEYNIVYSMGHKVRYSYREQGIVYQINKFYFDVADFE